jgi:predicted Zn-dependent protease
MSKGFLTMTTGEADKMHQIMWLSARRRRVGLYSGFLFTIFPLFLAACAVNPVTKQKQFVLMSEQREIALGREAYPIYTQMSLGLFQEEALQAYVQRIGSQLAAKSHRPNLQCEFNVVNGSELNAYALPGGKISITRGLISRMENEAQLAAVLAHEIGHVSARHSVSGYTRQTLAGLITTIGRVAIDASGVGGGDLLMQGGLLATNLVLMKYSRAQEEQSDELGLEYMTRAGYNPEGFVQSMEILMRSREREPTMLETFFSSHPLTSKRIEAARQRLGLFDPTLRIQDRLGADPFHRATWHLREVAPAYAKMDEGKKILAGGDASAAVGFLEEATRMAPGEALIWINRAVAEASLDQTQRALTSAEKAVAIYPDLFQARFVSGVLNFKLDRFQKSLSHLEVADQLVPGQPQVAFFMGRNFEALGKRDNAARAYTAVLEKVTKGPMAEYSYSRLVEWGYIRPTTR